MKVLPEIKLRDELCSFADNKIFNRNTIKVDIYEIITSFKNFIGSTFSYHNNIQI